MGRPNDNTMDFIRKQLVRKKIWVSIDETIEIVVLKIPRLLEF